MTIRKLLAATAMLTISAASAHAALVEFQTFSGKYAVSTDGASSTGNVSTISASIPSGSTIAAAYLYTATQDFSSASQPTFFETAPTGVELNGNEVTYDATFPNFGTKAARSQINLSSHRADVTSIVEAAYDPVTGGVIDFNYAETGNNFNIDGSGLVVVYENPALSQRTVSILNGAQNSDGDQFVINFANPVDKSDANAEAELFLGINFSCCNQKSIIDVNGNRMTSNAGNFDDGLAAADGQLITVGSFDDPVSPLNPSYATDTERYSLLPFLNDGDTAAVIDTQNPTDDDNIFLAVLSLSGEASIDVPTDPNNPSAVPIPASMGLMLTAMAGFGLAGFRRKTRS